MSEFINSHSRMLAVGIALAGNLALTGYSSAPANSEGIGDEFEVQGAISRVDPDGTIRLEDDDQFKLIAATGKAHDWFVEKEGLDGPFDDDFDLMSYYGKPDTSLSGCGDTVRVGQVYDTAGNPIDVGQLKEGTKVSAKGTVRDSQKFMAQVSGTVRCVPADKAVYERVDVIGRGW